MSRSADLQPGTLLAWLAVALALWLAGSPAQAVTSGPLRKVRVDLLVIHSTGGPTCDEQGRPIWVPAGNLEEDLRTIEHHPKLGVHYLIGRDGEIRSSVPEDRIAHHVFHYSASSIGIELVNDGNGIDPYPPRQLDALVSLLKRLSQKYGILRNGIRRHSDLDHGRMTCAPERPRKVDPGAAFPADEVLRRVFEPAGEGPAQSPSQTQEPLHGNSHQAQAAAESARPQQ